MLIKHSYYVWKKKRQYFNNDMQNNKFITKVNLLIIGVN